MASHLRAIFSSTWNFVEAQKVLPENVNKKTQIKIPEEIQEFLMLSETNLPDVFLIECLSAKEKNDVKTEVDSIDELGFETSYTPQFDTNATVKEVTRLQKVRKLDRSIGESLKELYNFRCQMTGERIGEAQNALCVEAHHIQPFTKSLNNNYSNITILSPSYHRIIHKTNPIFDRNDLSFHFPNGLVEYVKIDKHLKL